MGETRSTKGDIIAKSNRVICGICGKEIMDDEEIAYCDECITYYHKHCWTSRGGCANPECAKFVVGKNNRVSASDKILKSLIENGMETLKSKDFAKALKFFNKALEMDCNNAEAQLGIELANNSVTSKKELENKKRIAEIDEKINALSVEKKKLEERELRLNKELEALTNEKSAICTDLDKLSEEKSQLLDDGSTTKSVRVAFKVKLVNNGAIIVGLTSKRLSNVSIPAEINGKPVIEIGELAFYDCKELKSVKIPNSVIKINESAFAYCPKLESVEIPKSVKEIGMYAFSHCTQLTHIKIPRYVSTIGKRAFESCSTLKIKCETNRQPDGWSNDWNYSNCPVKWGC